MRAQNTCDLCDHKADYHLCQMHLDDFRWPDVFSTDEGDYPEPGRMVLWSYEGETVVGGYHQDYGWFSAHGYTYDGGISVLWCYLPDLYYLFKYQRETQEAKGDS